MVNRQIIIEGVISGFIVFITTHIISNFRIIKFQIRGCFGKIFKKDYNKHIYLGRPNKFEINNIDVKKLSLLKYKNISKNGCDIKDDKGNILRSNGIRYVLHFSTIEEIDFDYNDLKYIYYPNNNEKNTFWQVGGDEKLEITQTQHKNFIEYKVEWFDKSYFDKPTYGWSGKGNSTVNPNIRENNELKLYKVGSNVLIKVDKNKL